jgi:error-prone DNA polymerase
LELPLNHPYEDLKFSDVPADQRLLSEYQVLGFATSGHPFTLVTQALPQGIVRSDRLEDMEHGAAIQVAGLVVARQRPGTAKGFTFILLEDEAGMMNAIVRPDVYDRDRVTIRGEPLVWILGRLARDDGTVNVIAEEVRPLKLRSKDSPSNRQQARSPSAFLKDLRRSAPGSKNWG